MIRLTRRGFIAGAAACASVGVPTLAAGRSERLYADVLRYERFGAHRTASPGDVATSRWIARRLRRLGFAVELRPFAHELFEPEVGTLAAGGHLLPTFPLWPVTETPREGVRGPIVSSRPAGRSEVALVRLPYAPNATLSLPGYARPIHDAVRAGPAAVVGVTDGPTGEAIALNVAADADAWPMPVALIGSRDARRLGEGNVVSLSQYGRRRRVRAYNVLARRPGRGSTIIVSTPTSGWLTCAGERGAGIALFLAMAEHCAARRGPPLLFMATSGHEFEGMGSRAALTAAPDPHSVGAWIHIGANVAGAALQIEDGRVIRLDRPSGQVGAGATAPLFPVVSQLYQGIEGYRPAVRLDETTAIGDVGHYFEAGYRSLMGVVGAHPLHHTRLDVASLATSPRLLDRALQPLIQLLDRAMGLRVF